MPPKKPAPAAAQPSLPVAGPQPATTATTTAGRKKWIPKTPVEAVLEQIQRQERKVAEMREELAKEERGLAKLQKAKQVLESA